LFKRLEVGRAANMINARRQGDLNLLAVLEDMTAEKPVVRTEPHLPIFYLAAREIEAYKPRIDGDLATLLDNAGEPDDGGPVDRRFHRSFDKLFVKTASGRWLVPFECCFGKGVPLVDVTNATAPVLIEDFPDDYRWGNPWFECAVHKPERYV
jgi:hypothetical protein